MKIVTDDIHFFKAISEDFIISLLESLAKKY